MQFAVRGARTEVVIGRGLTSGPTEVTALTTESRDLDPASVRRANLQAGKIVHELQPSEVFKKIDSTMRGDVPAEIAAALEGCGFDRAIVAPAFPAMGRTVIEGFLHVHGEPTVRLASRFPDSNCRIFDALCDSDLDNVVREVRNSGERVLWVGSAGLAAALARAHYPNQYEGATLSHHSPRVVFCIGSDHAATATQQKELLARGIGNDILIRIERGQTSTEYIRELLEPLGRVAIFACGGDTASLVCRALDVRRIELQGEIVSGLPWGRVAGGSLDGAFVATKSGGFGAPDALLKVANFFHA